MQSKESTTKINSFADRQSAKVVLVDEESFKKLLGRLEFLENKVMELEAWKQQHERVFDIYICPDPRVIDLSHEDNIPLTVAAKKKAKAAKEYGSKIIECEERLTDLENSRSHQQMKKKAGKISEERMLKLAITLLNRKNNPITFAETGKILELGSHTANGEKNTRKQNMTKFSQLLLAARERFVISDCKTSGGKQIYLTKIYYDHLFKEYVG